MAKAKPKQIWVVVEHASGFMRVRGVFDDALKAKEAAKLIDVRVAGPFYLNEDAPAEPEPATDVEVKP